MSKTRLILNKHLLVLLLLSFIMIVLFIVNLVVLTPYIIEMVTPQKTISNQAPIDENVVQAAIKYLTQ